MQSNERLRVLQIVETLDVGGMERMVATLCRTLDPASYDVRVLVTRKLGAIGDQLVQSGVRVDCAGLRPDGADYFAIRRIVSYIKEFGPHALHTHATHALLYGGAAAHLAGVPAVVHTEHGRVFPDRPHIMRAERWLSRNLVRYVVVSEQLREAVHRYEGIPLEKIMVIPNGVADLSPPEKDKVCTLRSELVRGRPGPVIGVTARLVWEKGLDVLLRAWAARRTAPELRGTLIIAGEGPERPELEQLALDLGISDSVLLPGTIADVSSFYRLLDVFVLSSVSEGLPMALLEAMAAGLPIVATRIGGIPDALGHGSAGMLVEPSDHEALGMTIDAVLSDYSLAEGRSSSMAAALGTAARQRFLAMFTAHAMTGRYSALYSATRYPF